MKFKPKAPPSDRKEETGMIYYAIKRKKDGKLVSGSDFRYRPPHCIMADEHSRPLLLTEINLQSELLHRRINLKHYKIIKVKIEEVNE